MGGPSKREGRYAHIELIHFVLQQKLTEHCKAIMLQEKTNYKIKIFLVCLFSWYKPSSKWLLEPLESCTSEASATLSASRIPFDHPVQFMIIIRAVTIY